MKIVDGWLTQATKFSSPNFNIRPINQAVNLLVIHNISLPPAEFGNCYIEKFFLNQLPYDDHCYFEQLKGLEVSSHFLIKRSGEILQFVSCDNRAWHAGQSSYCGKENCNDFSIGIELEGTDHIPYEISQYNALHLLTLAIQNTYPEITNSRITGHEQISPGRKTDPGPSFNWPTYLARLR